MRRPPPAADAPRAPAQLFHHEECDQHPVARGLGAAWQLSGRLTDAEACGGRLPDAEDLDDAERNYPASLAARLAAADATTAVGSASINVSDMAEKLQHSITDLRGEVQAVNKRWVACSAMVGVTLLGISHV